MRPPAASLSLAVTAQSSSVATSGPTFAGEMMSCAGIENERAQIANAAAAAAPPNCLRQFAGPKRRANSKQRGRHSAPSSAGRQWASLPPIGERNREHSETIAKLFVCRNKQTNPLAN